MKKLHKPVIFCVVLLMFAGCKKDLNLNPTDQLSAGIFWKSKSDFDMALAGCYNTLQDYFISSGIQDFDGLSDNGFDWFSYGNEQSIDQSLTVSSHATDFWYYNGYRRLATYNTFLQNLSQYKGTDISASDKNYYMAQVQLFRAMEYYRLYTLFGSVPLVTVPLTIATEQQAKAPASDIFNQIISDCDFAIANLPDVPFSANNDHFVKASAQLLAARAYLYVGYDQNGHAVVDNLTKAAQLTTAIINSGLYKLSPYYRGLFAHSLGQQENNPEYIGAVHYLAPSDNKYGQYGFNISTMQFYWVSVSVLPSLLNEYEFSDGTPYNPSDSRVDHNYLYKNRDPRMGETVCKDTVHWEDGTWGLVNSGKSSTLPYIYWKVCDEDEVKQNGGTSNQKSNTLVTSYVPIMRYAEVLLSDAEAINEITGPTPQVYQDINLIRARVNMPALPPGLDQSQMRARIRHERRVELAFEGFRYLDLKRWHLAQTVLDGFNDGVITRTFPAKNYLWPLPEQELQINKLLVQNPDYK